MGRIIAMLSGKGGVGKSSISVMLGTELAKTQKVLLIDMDIGFTTLDIMLGTEDKNVFNFGDVLNGIKETAEAVVNVSSNLFFLSAPKSNIDTALFRDFLNTAAEKFDTVLIDFPAGRLDEYISDLPKFTEILVVAEPTVVSCKDAGVMARRIEEENLLSVRLIINRFDYKALKHSLYGRAFMSVDNIIDTAGARLIGIVPEDRWVVSLQSGKCKPKGAKRAVERIAERLNGKNVPLKKLKKIK